MAISNNQPIVKACYECFAKGDIDGILVKLADDIVWEGPDQKELPYSGTFKGKSGVKQFFIGIGQIDVSSFEPMEYFDCGDAVVVLGRWAGKVRKTGKTFQTRWVMVWDFSKGKVKRFRTLEEVAPVAAAFRK